MNVGPLRMLVSDSGLETLDNANKMKKEDLIKILQKE